MGILQKVNEEAMYEALNPLLFPNEEIEAAVYAIYRPTGFFSSVRQVDFGYLALTNQNRLIGYRYGTLMGSAPIAVDLNAILKMRFRKRVFGLQRELYLETMSAKSEKLLVLYNMKIFGSQFPNQKENAERLSAVLAEKAAMFK